MIEWLALPAAAAVVAFLPGKMDDKQKINIIFENIGLGIKKKDGSLDKPKFKKKEPIMDGSDQVGMMYLYSIPLGLPASKTAKMEQDIKIFSDGLKKPVIIEYKRHPEDLKKPGDFFLQFHVFHQGLPDLFKYEQVPKNEKEWVIPLGKGLKGILWHNFDHVPHMTVAGTTRFGKTVFLRMLITYLIECHGDNAEIFIIDLKGGLEFGRYECIRQIKRVASDPAEAAELLAELDTEIQDKDYIYFRKNNLSNIVDTSIKRRRFIIVDEAAQLAPDRSTPKKYAKLLEYCQHRLSEISRVSGALGYRLIYATQYPTADTLPRQIKMNSDAKITYRLPSGYASQVAIDDTGAEELPSNIKGRALFKTHEVTEVQTPFLTHKEMWELLEKYQEPKISEGEAENVINTVEESQARANLVEFR
jgi:S-DNA-T family DNA segregation ATPase FtsK/SpoIIIE